MILNILLGVGLLTTAIVAPNAVQLFKYFNPKNSQDRWEMKRSFSRLEKKGFVKRKTTKGEDYYSLTLLGNERAKKYKLNSMRIQTQKKWDGLWRIVMFDIPEEKMMARRAINLILKKLGCVQYQKSVFITPYPCEKEINFVGECFDARKYLRIITAKEVEGVEQIKKVFKQKI
jgi:phenylacetic acid degradation operon negative regulatory protein